MNLADIKIPMLDGSQRERRLQHFAMIRDPFKSTSEAIVIELLSGETEVIGDRCFLRPIAEMIHRLRTHEPIGDQDFDERPERHVSFPRSIVVNDFAEPHCSSRATMSGNGPTT